MSYMCTPFQLICCLFFRWFIPSHQNKWCLDLTQWRSQNINWGACSERNCWSCLQGIYFLSLHAIHSSSITLAFIQILWRYTHSFTSYCSSSFKSWHFIFRFRRGVISVWSIHWAYNSKESKYRCSIYLIPAARRGTIRAKHGEFRDVLYVPSLVANMLYVY